MTFKLGLTGSIGMGKSTTAAMFRDLGVPVWDADASVARLYSKGGAAVPKIATLCPGAVQDGEVNRDVLKTWIRNDPQALSQIEKVVHPLVGEDRARFLEDAGDGLVVLDIPLLYETGLDRLVDAVLVVSAPAEIQRARVLARPGMTEEQLDNILARQMPDAEKRARADFVIETRTLEEAARAVQNLVGQIRDRLAKDA